MTSSERLKILDGLLEELRYEAEQCEWPDREKSFKERVEALQYILDFYESNA